MATKAPAIVRGEDGLLGTILGDDRPDPADPGSSVDVLLEDGRRLLIPRRFLKIRADGSYALTGSIEEIERSAEGLERTEVVVPVVAEEVEVGKRRVEAGTVRVHKKVRTREESVDVPVSRDEVEVERVPIGRMIDEPVGPRQEGDTLIVPLLEEVLVVEKRLMLKEELRITRRRVEQKSSRKVTLRAEEATVERVDAEDRPNEAGQAPSDRDAT